MKFILGVLVGAALVLVGQWFFVWEVRIPPPNKGGPPIKVRAEVKEAHISDLMLLMKPIKKK